MTTSDIRLPDFTPADSAKSQVCPACDSCKTFPFFEIPRVPTNSCILLDSFEEAINCSYGRLLLCICEECGFIGNHAFEPELTEYSERYEETQGFSATFSGYLQDLTKDLVARFELQGKRIIEIGCGKGEFLALLCEIAEAHGVGFDPAFREDRNPAKDVRVVRYVQEFYSEKYAGTQADFYCNRMTLEHIPTVLEFLSMVRRCIGDRPDAVFYTQVPEASRILEHGIFCDLPYEHCSYFTDSSLTAALQRAGFDVIETQSSYEGQHLAVSARPSKKKVEKPCTNELRRLAEDFPQRASDNAASFIKLLNATRAAGERMVLWGSGSKSTALLTSLGIIEEIEEVVDINPHRHGKFMAGTGQKIIAPESLISNPPEHIYIMNSIYKEEINKTLRAMNLEVNIHY